MCNRRFFLAICFLALLPACQEERLSLALTDSNKLMAEGHYEQAERLCFQSLKELEKNDNATAREQKQFFLEKLIQINCEYRQDYRQAIHLLKQLARIVSPEEQYQIKLRIVDIYEENMQLPAEVVFALRDLIPQAEEMERPELDTLYFRLARNLFAIHRYDQAREAVRTMLVNCPDSELNFKSQVLMANCYFIQEEYYKAIAVYRSLLEQPLNDEQEGIVNFELGSCYQLLSEQKEALVYYKKALHGHPNPQMVQHHITYIQALVDNANVQKQIKRSMLEQAWLKQAYPEQAGHNDLIMK